MVLVEPLRVIAQTRLGTAAVRIVEDAGGTRIVVPGPATQLTRDAPLASRALLSHAPDDADFSLERFADPVPAAGERAIEADQTNDSVVVGEQVIVKWQVALGAEPSPVLDRIRLLIAGGFRDMPEPVAVLTWRQQPIAIATVFIPGAVDGWDWAVELVRAWARGAAVDEPISAFAEAGAITGRLHRALAAGGVSAIDAMTWQHHALDLLDRARRVTRDADAEQLADLAPRMAADLASLSGSTTAMAIHGDLHIGQFLRDPSGALRLTDFDGNPVLDAAARRAPDSPARDVAGMLASIDHVGRIVLHRTPDADAARVTAWIPRAQDAFLRAYASIADDLLDARLLRPFRVEQECREYVYAAEHLPHWRYVPHAALAALYPEV